jgi:acetyl esterase/lipase
MTGLGIAVAVLLLLWCALLFVPFPWRPVGIFLIMEKALAVGYAPFIAAIGVALVVVGGVFGSWWIAVPAGLAALGALAVILRVGSVRVDLSGALGVGWEDRIPAERRTRMVSRWWTGRLRSDPKPRLRQDIPFATVAGTDRVLLCDIWQPPVGVSPSGVAVVYLHGSAYYVLDKDLATRPLFRHLAAQGHVVASLYGQVGLDTMYWHTSQDKSCHPDDQQPDWTAPPSRALVRLFGNNAARLRLQFMTYGGRSDWLTGGTPDDVPDRYAQASVFSYIQPDCPPTLLMHGTHDEMAPVAAVRQLQHRLEEAGVAVTAVYVPHTDHMFDLIGSRWSPAARVAFYALERFLAVISTTEKRPLTDTSPEGSTRKRKVSGPSDESARVSPETVPQSSGSGPVTRLTALPAND